MKYRLLGPVEVAAEDGPVALGGPKPRAVLAVLLLNANRPVSTERLAVALWGEDAPAGAAKTVQVHVSRLRKALPDADVVTTTPAGYQLTVQPGELDVDRFEQLLDHGRRALRAGRPDQASAALEEGLALWRGDQALADVAFEPFAAPEINRLEDERLAALETRADAELAAGRHAALVGELQRLVDAHPSRERFAAQLMLALYRSDRQTEALEAYREARAALVEHSGIEPGSELRRLHEAILRQDESLRAPPALELPPELDTVAAPPLEGRAAELSRLEEAWERARAGEGSLVTLTGERGIGKTRLAAELAGEVHRHGAAVLYATGAGPPATVRAMFARAREATDPLLAVVDDADRLTPDLRAELEQLAASLAGLPVLVVAGARDDTALARANGRAPLALKPLDVEAVAAVVAIYAPGRPPADLPAQSVLEESGGVPARVHEVASDWARLEASRRVEAVAEQAARGRVRLRTMEDELAGGVKDLQAARERAAQVGAGDGPVVCPFKGLASFDVDDAEYYFGRERLVAALVARLVGAPLLGIVGPSGSGKSSALRAGLLPALASGVLPGSSDWEQVVIRPGEHPLEELNRTGAAVSDQARVVLAVDQFEETFMACDDERERAAFVGSLVHAARDTRGRCMVVLAIRADHYERCAAYPELSSLLAANHVLVTSMRRDELRQAIERPAQRVGLGVEPELVDALVADVEGAPGALPLLSTALLELWQQRDGRRLRHAAYERTGGVRGAVARLAEDAYGRLDPAQQGIAHSILVRLAAEGPGGRVERRRVPLAELETERGGDVARVVELFTDQRLLTVTAGSVEVAHEALLREWPRLHGWIEQDRVGLRIHRGVTAAAHEWRRLDRDEGALFRGSRLTEALDWRDTHDVTLNELEREFLDASHARRRSERAYRRRWIRTAFAGLLVALAAITTVAIVALYQGREAERQRDIAASRELAARATSFLDGDPGLSLALALEALDRQDTEQARNVLRQATLASRTLSVWPAHRDWVNSVEPSADGRRVVTAGRDGVVRVWNLARGRAETTIKAHDGWALGASLSPDGRHVASAGDDGIVALWDLNGKQERVLLRVPPGKGPNGVEFSPDGQRVIVPLLDGTVRLVPVDGAGPPTVLGEHEGAVWVARFSRDGTQAVSAGDDHSVRVWSLATGESTVLPHPGLTLYGVDFSPDGKRVATASDDGAVRIWNADGRGRPRIISASKEAVDWVEFSEDGRRLVTAGDDAVVRVFDARGGPPLDELTGHKGIVLRAAFVPHTDTIVSGGEDQTLRRWASAPAAMLQAPVTTASFRPDGRQVLTGSPSGPLRIWNPEAGSVRALPGHRSASFPQFSADGLRAISAGWDGTARLWDLTSGRQTVVFSAPDVKLFAATIDPAGRRIAVAGGRQEIVVQNLDGGDRQVLSGHSGVVRDVAFSPDGTRLASASDDGTVRSWNAETGGRGRSLRGHGQSVNSVSFSPDGRRILSAGADGTIRVWNLDGDPPVILTGHEGPVASARFDRSGERIVSAGRDGTIRVWSSAGGEALVVLFTHDAPALSAQFSPSGDEVVSAADDGITRVTPCEVCGSISSVLRLAQTRAGRELTPVERRRYLPSND